MDARVCTLQILCAATHVYTGFFFAAHVQELKRRMTRCCQWFRRNKTYRRAAPALAMSGRERAHPVASELGASLDSTHIFH